MKKISKALLDKHRDINVSHNWHEDVYECFIEEIEAKHHFTPEKLEFSGFWSQGDGASFTGRIHKVALFMKSTDLHKSYPAIHELASDESEPLYIDISRSRGNYSHSGMVYAELQPQVQYADIGWSNILGDDPFMQTIAEVKNAAVTEEMETFEKELTSVLHNMMDDLYSRLDDEYDYQTKDEQVKEAIIANDLQEEEEEDVEDEEELVE